MKIQVTDKHIRESLHCATNCPIALAIKEVLGRGYTLGVSPDGESFCLYFKRTDDRFRPLTKVILPKQASKFIKEFDQGKQVEPFEFELEV
jgi:hypothetical protein